MSWHLVFGGISLAIAVLGMCMQGLAAVGTLANPWMMSMAGMETTPPPDALKYAGGAQAGVLLLLGGVLAAGSAMLLLRRPLGAKLVLVWAVSRLLMVVVGVVVAVALIKPQTEWAVVLSSEIRDHMRKQNVPEEKLPPLVDAEQAQRDAIRNLAIFSLAFAVWPFTMAIVLTRARVRADVESWKSPSVP
jgi:hypothetical protein